MPKSKSRKRKNKPGSSGTVAWSGGRKKSSRKSSWLVIALVAVAGLGAGGYIWQSIQVDRAFQALTEEGKPLLTGIESLPNRGRTHLTTGQSYSYRDDFPTSGPHAPFWAYPGFYTDSQPPTMLVHALEHGHVVIYYDQPAPENIAIIKQWAGTYSGNWSGVLAVPRRGLKDKIVLTAWQKRMKMDTFDTKIAAAFIDAYRGRGPERQVR